MKIHVAAAAGAVILVAGCGTTGTQSALKDKAYVDPKIQVSFSDPAWADHSSKIWREYRCVQASCAKGSVLRWRATQSIPGEQKRIKDGEINDAYVETTGKRIAREKRVEYVYSKSLSSKAYSGYDLMLKKRSSFSGMNFRLARVLFTDKTSFTLTSQSNSEEQTKKNMQFLFSSVKFVQ